MIRAALRLANQMESKRSDSDEQGGGERPLWVGLWHTAVKHIPGDPFYSSGTFIDPHREYNFHFRLLKPLDLLDSSTERKSLLHPLLNRGVKLDEDDDENAQPLFSDDNLDFISSLAEQVTVPPNKFQVMPVQIGTIQVSFPKGFEVPTFFVQYLDTENLFVRRFHLAWQGCVRWVVDSDDGVSPCGGMSFIELGRVCGRAEYSPLRVPVNEWEGHSRYFQRPRDRKDLKQYARLDHDLDPGIVTGSVKDHPYMETFPYIFPVDVSGVTFNKAGSNLTKTTVTYARVVDTRGLTASWFCGERRSPGKEIIPISLTPAGESRIGGSDGDPVSSGSTASDTQSNITQGLPCVDTLTLRWNQGPITSADLNRAQAADYLIAARLGGGSVNITGVGSLTIRAGRTSQIQQFVDDRDILSAVALSDNETSGTLSSVVRK